MFKRKRLLIVFISIVLIIICVILSRNTNSEGEKEIDEIKASSDLSVSASENKEQNDKQVVSNTLTDVVSPTRIISKISPTPEITSVPVATISPAEINASTTSASPTGEIVNSPTSRPINTPTNLPINTPTGFPISTPTNTPTSIPTITPTNTPIPVITKCTHNYSFYSSKSEYSGYVIVSSSSVNQIPIDPEFDDILLIEDNYIGESKKYRQDYLRCNKPGCGFSCLYDDDMVNHAMECGYSWENVSSKNSCYEVYALIDSNDYYYYKCIYCGEEKIEKEYRNYFDNYSAVVKEFLQQLEKINVK